MIKKLPVVVKAPTPLADYYGWKVRASKANPRLRRSAKRGPNTMDYVAANHPAHHETAPPETFATAANVGIEFPLPSPEVRAMNRILSSAPVDLKQLGELAEGYPLLTCRVLQLCHTSLFNLAEPVTRIEHAVILAGAENVRTLLLADAIMGCAARLLPEMVARAFWRHNLLVAQLSERLALWTRQPEVEQAYLAGLLHDIGTLPLLALTRCEHGASQSPVEWITDDPEIQRQRFGTDHCALGSRIGAAWDFPLSLVDVFGGHHDLSDSSAAFAVTHLVAVAERVCQACGAGLHPTSTPSASPARLRIEQIVMECLPGLEASDSVQLAQFLDSDLADTSRRLAEKVPAGAVA